MAIMIDEILAATDLGDAMASLAARVSASVVRLDGPHGGSGSGIVWDAEGLIVTNHHVAPGEAARVALPGGKRMSARVTARDESLDLAALQLDASLPDAFGPATVGDSTQLRPGQLVVAVGNPLGERNAVTLGIVAGTPPRGGPGEAIRLAITLRPGNSGGALADVEGRVVGIPHMVVGRGLALAIPSHTVEAFLRRPRGDAAFFGLGVQWVHIPESLAGRYRLPDRAGILILAVMPGSPAEQAGLLMGDVVVQTQLPSNGANGHQRLFDLRHTSPGSPVGLTVLRGGELLHLEVVPEARAVGA